MIVKYEITEDDLVAFHRYHCAHSAAVKKKKYIAMLAASVVIVGGSLLVPLPDVSPSLIVGVAIPVAAVFCIVYNFWTFPKAIDQQVRRMLKEGANKAIIGDQQIEVDDSGIVKRNAVSESRFSWIGVERIAETDTHAFIYVASTVAIVIPKRSCGGGDPVEIIALLKQSWIAANPDAVTKQYD